MTIKNKKAISNYISIITINFILFGLLYIILTVDFIKEGKKRTNIITLIKYRVADNLDVKYLSEISCKKFGRYAVINEQGLTGVKTDAEGFIYPSKIHDNPDLNIMFVGGSTTENAAVEEKKRFPYLVGRLLEKSLNIKVNSYNAGMGRMHSLNSINTFINKSQYFDKLDYVVLMHNVNDLSTLLHFDSYVKGSRSAIQCPGAKIDVFDWENASKDYGTKRGKWILNKFKQNLQLFISSAKALGVKPVLMTQANKINSVQQNISGFSSKELVLFYKKLYVEFNSVIRRTAKENNILLIDLEKRIPTREIYIFDEVHFTNEGSELAAKIIEEKLRKYINQ